MAEFNLSGKTAVITGGARGIGRETAVLMAKCGANVVINYNSSEEAAKDLRDEINHYGKCEIVRGSVADSATAKETVARALSVFGSVDILVNNAGITKDGLIMRMSDQDFTGVIDVNLTGAFNFIREVTKPMLKQKSGSIVNISSVIGIAGNAGQANYAASKAGLIGLSKSVAKELAPKSITCNVVAPGFIVSDMTGKLSEETAEEYKRAIPLKRFGTSLEVARLIAFLSSDLAKYITGQIIGIDGGLFM